MSTTLARRSNAHWIDVIRGRAPDTSDALAELEGYVRGSLVRVLGGTRRVSDDDLAEFAQETMLRLVERIDSFRGESAFPTWAVTVATRVAFTALRRRTVRLRGRQAFDEAALDARSAEGAPALDGLERGELLAALHDAIRSELTERQRVAVLAELRGLPSVEIAERMGTNTNALYKLVHDARRKLRAALRRAGHGADALDGGVLR